MTDSQLSARINISRRTLQQYRDNGRIAFYRLDGKILYDEDDVRAFLALSYRPKFDD
ncbi:helix-turn-helix domain-containing protein [uncultured Duncaniella sp.]|uniref:helix-turn-helix domain-containing protein n=1 Tax=uncultured Duncaniella sp. TaxID=2768039 RepID=UPI0025B3AE04|nr:helix-turn-helix domain-containing protein [uncultured Duncaniella sp.]